MANLRSQIIKALEMQANYSAHPRRKFCDGQVVICPPGEVGVIRFASPLSLEGDEYTWVYCCVNPDNPNDLNYFPESHLSSLGALKTDGFGNFVLTLEPIK